MVQLDSRHHREHVMVGLLLLISDFHPSIPDPPGLVELHGIQTLQDGFAKACLRLGPGFEPMKKIDAAGRIITVTYRKLRTSLGEGSGPVELASK